MDTIDTNCLENLLELIGGEKEALDELISTFLIEGQEMIDDMRRSLSSQDQEVLRRSSHSMKSSAQDFGATKLSELAASLEYNCKNNWPSQAEQQVDTITTQFKLASQALTDYLKH